MHYRSESLHPTRRGSLVFQAVPVWKPIPRPYLSQEASPLKPPYGLYKACFLPFWYHPTTRASKVAPIERKGPLRRSLEPPSGLVGRLRMIPGSVPLLAPNPRADPSPKNRHTCPISPASVPSGTSLPPHSTKSLRTHVNGLYGDLWGHF